VSRVTSSAPGGCQSSTCTVCIGCSGTRLCLWPWQAPLGEGCQGLGIAAFEVPEFLHQMHPFLQGFQIISQKNLGATLVISVLELAQTLYIFSVMHCMPFSKK